ncbi:photosynthetic reaction center subunit H [Elioraea sp.]|uniref:photosynthetic reaction center subunit H n=1 Tax=Elioraea sp. TaxID=2185103 RepID=UPI00307E7153
METGAITGHIDVAQVVLYAFWIFFAGLVFYLLRENKREGYPLVTDRTDGRVVVQGFPAMPGKKTFLLHDGRTVVQPRPDNEPPLAAVPVSTVPGSPLTPTGDPMQDGVGPAAYALRADEPERAFDDHAPKIVPLRVATGFHLDAGDPDPRGWPVVAADGRSIGTCRDLWVDRSEVILRYLEVEATTPAGPRQVLVPMTLVRVDAGRRRVTVASVLARHFAAAPGLRAPEQITMREEDRISAYFGGGHLYATPDRLGPLL